MKLTEPQVVIDIRTRKRDRLRLTVGNAALSAPENLHHARRFTSYNPRRRFRPRPWPAISGGASLSYSIRPLGPLRRRHPRTRHHRDLQSAWKANDRRRPPDHLVRLSVLLLSRPSTGGGFNRLVSARPDFQPGSGAGLYIKNFPGPAGPRSFRTQAQGTIRSAQ
jgi:hypothetical protein